MTDFELTKAFSKGFANPEHLSELLKRTDLPQDRASSARTNLAQAYLSGQISIMKEITLPTELLNLPQPWGLTDPEQRRQQIELLSYDFNSTKTALNVLERSLHSLSELTLSETDCIPEEMITYWPFIAQWLAFSIPALDEFSLPKVEEFLICEPGIDSPSPDLIFDVGEYWVWWVTKSIEKAALNWVEDALMKNRDLILISRFLNIASRYWQKIKPRLAQSLLSASAMIGRQKALPLFERVLKANAPEAVKETARDYREFVLDNPEKWLPDPDPNARRQAAEPELPKKRPFFVPTPAFGQLAIP